LNDNLPPLELAPHEIEAIAAAAAREPHK